ncbi:hypothetical protein [Salimicrobium halophilum]|uniref:Uncharacterized protein n=1 Tax=Salimicrobium halophilum TaxID=86666 RepID=A0A1G8VJT2_9BACI|nr:hypothetical protein [Salimicrobium halophilum]SDJ66147.1 hypothetical protein SAMN04490247_2741 [Salimicrobium halophilum]
MLEDPVVTKAGVDMAKVMAKNTAESIRDRVRVARESKNDKETINVLNEIINELIEDKNQLAQVVQMYQDQLVSQRISEEDIEYISENFLPLLKRLQSNNEDEEKSIDDVKPLLSKETFNILQTLGFNYQRAIGEPLTEFVRRLISSNNPISQNDQLEIQALSEKKQIELFKVLQDSEAVKRYKEMQEFE